MIAFSSAATRRANRVIETNEGDFRTEIFLGETVTFESRNFGFKQKLSVKVVELEKPLRFTDEMTEGSFKSFRHVHEFIPQAGGTLLKDTFVWTSPLGVFGRLADRFVIKNLLRKTAVRRNAELKRLAEGQS